MVGKLPGINVLRVPLGPVQKNKVIFVLCKYIYHTFITILTAIVAIVILYYFWYLIFQFLQHCVLTAELLHPPPPHPQNCACEES